MQRPDLLCWRLYSNQWLSLDLAGCWHANPDLMRPVRACSGQVVARSHVISIRDDIRPADHGDRAVVLEPHFALFQEICEDVGGVLVVGGFVLRLDELLLQGCNLLRLFMFEGLRQLLNLQLLLHVCLCSTALGAGLEKMSADSIGCYTARTR